MRRTLHFALQPTLIRAFLAIALIFFALSGRIHACAFHLNTDLPAASLSQQLAGSAGLFAARLDPNNPFRFGELQLLKGEASSYGPPDFVDTLTRRRLAVSSERAVLFSRQADGTWQRFLVLDEVTRPVVDHILAQADAWAAPGGASARRDYAAHLLANPDPRLREIALRELDALDYRTLRDGHYDVSAEQLLRGIADIQAPAYAPIRILLLGILGGDPAKDAVAAALREQLDKGTATNLGPWVTAALELHGKDAFVHFDDLSAENGRPLSTEQTDAVVRSLALLSISGDRALRNTVRIALVQFLSHYPDASFFARAQALVSSVFTGSMTDMKAGFSTSSAFLAVWIAFLYGAVHTLGPGHGKAVVISYFIGSGGSLRRGVVMGSQIAVTHVLSAVVLVTVFDFAVRQATGQAPADLRLIRLGSYSAVSLIGAVMLWRAVMAIQQLKHHSHDHHDHSTGCASCAAAAKRAETGAGWLATAIGVVPCTGALMIMLYGLANDLIGPAVILVVAISLGMQIAMIAIGLLAIWGHNLASVQMASNADQRVKFEIGARVFGATVVMLIGALLFLTTLTASSIKDPFVGL